MPNVALSSFVIVIAFILLLILYIVFLHSRVIYAFHAFIHYIVFEKTKWGRKKLGEKKALLRRKLYKQAFAKCFPYFQTEAEPLMTADCVDCKGTIFVLDGAFFCNRCGQQQVKTNGGFELMPNGDNLYLLHDMKKKLSGGGRQQ
ncbi:MAG: hypothetical protein V1661_03245 [bacterium]